MRPGSSISSTPTRREIPAFQSHNETFMAAWQALMPGAGKILMAQDSTRRWSASRARTRSSLMAPTRWPNTGPTQPPHGTGGYNRRRRHSRIRRVHEGWHLRKDLRGDNPTDEQITVHFTGGNVSESFSVDPKSIVSKSSDRRNSTFKPSQITIPASRLYMGPTSPTPGPSASPSPLPLRGQLSHTSGTWLPTQETAVP